MAQAQPAGTAWRHNDVNAVTVEMKVNPSLVGNRIDADIAASARNILRVISSLPQGAVMVAIEDGWLTLSGVVSWQYQRQIAANSVRYLPGVAGIRNQIAIKPTATFVKSDIEAALKHLATADAGTIAIKD